MLRLLSQMSSAVQPRESSRPDCHVVDAWQSNGTASQPAKQRFHAGILATLGYVWCVHDDRANLTGLMEIIILHRCNIATAIITRCRTAHWLLWSPDAQVTRTLLSACHLHSVLSILPAPAAGDKGPAPLQTNCLPSWAAAWACLLPVIRCMCFQLHCMRSGGYCHHH